MSPQWLHEAATTAWWNLFLMPYEHLGPAAKAALEIIPTTTENRTTTTGFTTQ